MSIAVAPNEILVDELTGLARAYEESQAFVSLLAHELRSRLKITERALFGAAENDLETALQNTRDVQDLVESLLELARGRGGAPTDAGIAAGRVRDDLRAEAELRRAEILVGALPVVSLPQTLLETILRNLIV